MKKKNDFSTHHPPPQRVSIGGDVRLVHITIVPLLFLLRQIHEVRGEDKPQEPDVQGGDQFL